MNPNIKRHLAILFLVLLIPLTVITLLGVWDILDDETIWDAVWTLLVVGTFLAIAITVLSFIDIERTGTTKKKKKYNEFHHDE